MSLIDLFTVQVHFDQPICLTGIKIGAAPATVGGLAGRPYIHLFAIDLTTQSAARFALVTQDCTLPDKDTKAVRLDVRISLPVHPYMSKR